MATAMGIGTRTAGKRTVALWTEGCDGIDFLSGITGDGGRRGIVFPELGTRVGITRTGYGFSVRAEQSGVMVLSAGVIRFGGDTLVTCGKSTPEGIALLEVLLAQPLVPLA